MHGSVNGIVLAAGIYISIKMKNIVKKVVLTLGLFFTISIAFSQEDALFKNVRSALKVGSSRELAKYFNETIELNINGESANYSSIHAEIYLKDFFKKYEPVEFEYAHQGSSSAGQKFAIGSYSYSGGSFRVLIRSKPFNGVYKIYIVDFIKE